MTITWTTGDFSTRAWEATEEIRRRIDALPLLTELADGSLEVHRFVEYLVQDDFYLRGYTRALAMLATRAPSPEASGFWAASASGAVAAEVQMHAGLMTDPLLAGAPRPTVASGTTRAYVNMLQTMTAYEPYEVGVAAVLPCYWVYADVGARLAQTASAVKDHPFGAWAAAYADPVFQDETRRAIELLDEAAAATDEETRERMLTAFVDATYYEEQFWARSYDLEAWQI
ncbi:TenA family protein [Tessaracoccus massiliensis]|uniref:TenA family protein n=1 Tax=Tessaracoccus massiliensis TaxID=1522311 RepID=UPI0006944AD5|nr:TenA family protein [Tessaracoccus massiliensis]